MNVVFNEHSEITAMKSLGALAWPEKLSRNNRSGLLVLFERGKRVFPTLKPKIIEELNADKERLQQQIDHLQNVSFYFGGRGFFGTCSRNL